MPSFHLDPHETRHHSADGWSDFSGNRAPTSAGGPGHQASEWLVLTSNDPKQPVITDMYARTSGHTYEYHQSSDAQGGTGKNPSALFRDGEPVTPLDHAEKVAALKRIHQEPSVQSFPSLVKADLDAVQAPAPHVASRGGLKRAYGQVPDDADSIINSMKPTTQDLTCSMLRSGGGDLRKTIESNRERANSAACRGVAP